MEAQTQSFLLEVLHVGREELEDPEHFKIMLLLAENRRRMAESREYWQGKWLTS